MRLSSFIRTVPQPVLYLFYIVIVFFLWVFDTLTGPDLSFLVFYLVPILMATWYSGKRAGGIIAVICAAAWFFSDVISHSSYSHPIVPYWNVTIKFCIFLIFVEILSRLKDALIIEKELARKDGLTGAANRRSFFESAAVEIDRMHRYKHPFSLAYIDLDDFKGINDTMGHDTGDLVLRTVAGTIIKNIRSTDIFARLGGDEFVLLLSETGAEQAQAVIDKLHAALDDRMNRARWPVSFSIGVMTFIRSPSGVDELIKKADALMYAAKREGKNRVKYSVWKESGSVV
jgi:diguanylate cyclase (GGDEF)-like protein